MDRLEIEAPQGKWWNMAYGAGYPDWLITSPLPPVEKGERWVWTGRRLVTLPEQVYEPWLAAHSQPMSMQAVWDLFRPHAEGHTREVVRLVLEAGLFVTWPWGLQSEDDTPEAIALASNPVTDPANPLPGVIPDNEWPGVIRMDRLVTLWKDAREHGNDGLFNAVQKVLSENVAWLVAQPLPKVVP